MINDALLSGSAADGGPQAGLPVTEVVKSLDIKKDATIPQPLPTDEEINIKESESIKFVVGESLEMKIGEVKFLELRQEPFISNLPYVTYESSNLRVARFIEDGVILACCPGTVKVTAITSEDVNNPLVATLTITVVDPNAPKARKGKK